MRQGTTTRERARSWLVACGIALATVGLFVSAMLVGSPAASGADAVKPGVPEFSPPELPREWRWERKAIRFDPMFRQMG